MSPEPVIYTVGHSRHSIKHFMALLTEHNVTAIADVRSTPWSKYSPQFNRELLTNTLKAQNIFYAYLGKELGGRWQEPMYHSGNRVDYRLVAQSDLFQSGIKRLLKGMSRYRIALLCSEKDPITCHRTLLVAHALKALDIRHILEDGAVETHAQAMKRLLGACNLAEDFFKTKSELIEQACDIQAERVAYRFVPQKDYS